MSSCGLSGVAALLRVTVAVPVSVATFPIGSAGAAGAAAAGGVGAAAGAGGTAGAGVPAGAGAGVGCACAKFVGPDLASIAAGASAASNGAAKTFAVPASMKQRSSQVANGSRCIVTGSPGRQ